MNRHTRRLKPRKLLVATAGAATLSYFGGACTEMSTSGNLMPPIVDGGWSDSEGQLSLPSSLPDDSTSSDTVDAGSQDAGAGDAGTENVGTSRP